MKIENYFEQREVLGVQGLFYTRGSFGVIDGGTYACEKNGATATYSYEKNGVRLCAEFTTFGNGVVLRKDTFENLTDGVLEVNALTSRFRMLGNSYEVYTQYSAWQHESLGAWQPLVTQVTAQTNGVRFCDGATPMLGMHDLYTGKNTVFHLLANCQWKMTARKVPFSDKEFVLVETGFNDTGLRLQVQPHEIIELPEVFFFEAENKTDLDAYKLHEVFNTLYPRKTLPVIYNSWLYCFDILDIDALKNQASVAAEMGFEAFMVDAGWFGEGDTWFTAVGDWEENLTGGPKGRLGELSEHVRSLGMVFGLWFEPERAFCESKAMKAHPEYFIENTFLDFSNDEARAYILDAVSKQMDKYQLGWVKFDYNATTVSDLSANAFYRYWQGYEKFIAEFKARYPHVYMTNCGGGGFRMQLWHAKHFDSFWFSDNQGPYDGIRIIKDTLKRMPTGCIERWNVQRYVDGFTEYGNPNPIVRGVNCNNATWDFLIGVNDSFVEAFMKGGPLGFSCDLASFPENYKAYWKEVIAQYKKDREFYRTATARILLDDERTIVIEYADGALSRCVLQVFTKVTYANDILVYPVVDENAEYAQGDTIVSGKELRHDGLVVNDLVNNNCRVIELLKK